MSLDETYRILEFRRLPARLTTSQVAVVLGMHADHIGWLVGARMLKPLGQATTGKAMYFAAKDIEALAMDVRWLSNATRIITTRIANKNQCSTTRKTYERTIRTRHHTTDAH